MVIFTLVRYPVQVRAILVFRMGVEAVLPLAVVHRVEPLVEAVAFRSASSFLT